MEDEAREILGAALKTEIATGPKRNLAEEIRGIMAPLGGVELELPPRRPVRLRPDIKG
jgi:plasmid stability protein